MILEAAQAYIHRLTAFALALALCLDPRTSSAQATPYSNNLLSRVRAAAGSVPGPRPRELRYVAVAEARLPLSYSVAGADTQRVTSVFSAFQIRFADRWIMVDAGLDSNALIQQYGPRAGGGYSRARYDSLQLALRDAELAVEYDLLHSLAPGVVLVRAPGHTPGSQLAYVQLDDGREVLLVGDLVWMMEGLSANAQKPQPQSDDLKEDRAAIQREMDWVRSVMSSIAVAPSHDKSRLDALVGQGLLQVGLDLHRD